MYGYCVFPSLSVPQLCLMNPNGEKKISCRLIMQVYAGFSCRKVQIFKTVMIHYLNFVRMYGLKREGCELFKGGFRKLF